MASPAASFGEPVAGWVGELNCAAGSAGDCAGNTIVRLPVLRRRSSAPEAPRNVSDGQHTQPPRAGGIGPRCSLRSVDTGVPTATPPVRPGRLDFGQL